MEKSYYTLQGNLHGYVYQAETIDTFTKEFGGLKVCIDLQQAVAEDGESWQQIAIHYNGGHYNGSMGSIRIDPDDPNTKDMFQTAKTEIEHLSFTNDREVCNIVHSMAANLSQISKKHIKIGALQDEPLRQMEFEFKKYKAIVQKDKDSHVSLLWQSPKHASPTLIAFWNEEYNPTPDYNVFEKAIEKITSLKDDELVLNNLYKIDDEIVYEMDEAYRNMLDKKAGDAVARLTKMRIMLHGFEQVREIANSLYDIGEEEYSNRLHIAITEMLEGSDFMRQHIVDQITAIAEEKGLTLTDEQIDNAANGVEYWINEGISDSINTALSDVTSDSE